MASSSLNPDAEPFQPRNNFFFPPSPTPIADGFPVQMGYPIHQNVKTDSVLRKRPVSIRTEWRVKGQNGGKLQENSGGNANGVRERNPDRQTMIPFPNTVEEAEASSVTTVMIRNIPNQFKFIDLLRILDHHCLQTNKEAENVSDWSKFDFLYLPMDYRKHAIESKLSNLGYAFVNFTTPSAAVKFYKQFQGYLWDVTENQKICEINAANFQGKEKLVRIFQKKTFRCPSPSFLPVVFSEGRDGMNRRVKGIRVGRHVRGLPRTTI